MDEAAIYAGSGDTIVFDSVSRMSRNAEEGIADYMELYNSGIELVFLNEPHIDTAKYREADTKAKEQAIHIDVETGNQMIDKLLTTLQDWINEFMLYSVSRDIQIEFEKAEAEIENLSQRTSDGMLAKGASKKISKARNGKKYRTVKSLQNRIVILQRSIRFGGTLNDVDIAKIQGISPRTVSRYSTEMMAELSVISKDELQNKLKAEIKGKSSNHHKNRKE